MVKCSAEQWMHSCTRTCLPRLQHQAVPPPSDRDVNHAQMENLLYFITKKCFRSCQRISAKPPSCLHFLRECLKRFPIPVYLQCLISGKWKKWGLWESSTVLVQSWRGMSAQLLVPAPYRQPPSLKKGEAAKGWVLCIWVCISLPKPQMSDQQILQGDGHFRALISTESQVCQE